MLSGLVFIMGGYFLNVASVRAARSRSIRNCPTMGTTLSASPPCLD